MRTEIVLVLSRKTSRKIPKNILMEIYTETLKKISRKMFLRISKKIH